jgi:hypothetical protein
MNLAIWYVSFGAAIGLLRSGNEPSKLHARLTNGKIMQSSMRLSRTSRNGRVADPDDKANQVHGVFSPLQSTNIENMGLNGAIYSHIEIDILEGG